MLDVNLILDRYPLVAQPRTVESLGSAGGMSGALFWGVKTSAGAFVLRRWPAEHPTADRLRWIHAVLQHASAHGCRVVPVPIVNQRGETFVTEDEHLWEVAPWMPGVADYESAPSKAKLAAAVEMLAKFHVSVADFRPSRSVAITRHQHVFVDRFNRLHELQPAVITALTTASNQIFLPQLAEIAVRFLRLLPHAVPRVMAIVEPFTHINLRVQPCLRDIWHDHVLFTGDAVTGLVDFGAMEICTPTTDVARLLGSLVGDDAAGWETGLAAYTSVRPLSPEELKAVAALDASGTILAGCNWIRWICVEHRQFENHAQVLSRFAKLLERTRTIVARHSV